MITNFFYAVADMFECLFEVLPYFGRFMNIVFTLIGFVGTIFWLWYAGKNRMGKRGVH